MASRIVAVFFVLAVLPVGLSAHAISLSTGELTVSGNEVFYHLKMPYYEISELDDPQEALFAHFHLYQDGEKGKRKSGACERDRDEIWYECTATYEFPEPVEQVDAECTYTKITVPNHVHVVKARMGEVSERVMFDFSSSRSTINFVPPTASEVAFSEIWAGIIRVIGGPIQILFVLALALAARRPNELAMLAGAFVLAEVISAAVIANKSWITSPRFIEAAAALTVAYLATEILLLPEAKHRWIVAAGMGVFHGFYFGNFLRYANMDGLYVLAGVAAAEVVLLVVFALGIVWLTKRGEWLFPVKAGAGLLLATGLVWFVLRVKG